MMMIIFANFLLVLGREREVWDSKGQVIITMKTAFEKIQ